MTSTFQKSAIILPWVLLIFSYVFYAKQTETLRETRASAEEHKLKAERYLSQIERLDGARAVLDQHGIIREWNQGCEDLFGYTANEALGFGVGFLLPKDMKANHRDAFERQMKNPQFGQVQSIVCDAVHSSGNLVQVEIRARIERSVDGPVAIATFDLNEDVKRADPIH